MPYALSFTKPVPVDDPDVYWNECCWGGDKISDRLLPMIRERYVDVQHDQEDWGWFIWFKAGQSKLAVDIFCDDPEKGKYRVFLTSQIKPFLFGHRITDSDELLVLKDRVRRELTGWVESDIVERLLDKNHDPIDPTK